MANEGVEDGSRGIRRRRVFRCVAIASSLGGPPALFALLPELCRRVTLPIFLVQHMAEHFTTAFARELNRRCRKTSRYAVEEAREGMRVAPYKAFVAPGDYHMLVSDGAVHIDRQMPKECCCRPAADVLFRSAATAYRGAVIGIVLTGMGADGTQGAAKIKLGGGYIFAQDRDSCAVWGMPRSVAEAGLADEVLSLREIPDGVERLVRSRQRMHTM